MRTPKVSVMFLSYNHSKHIMDAMESVLNQTFEDFEIIFSDDASTDETMELVSQIQDNRLHLHRFEQNQGATINHNYIWKHCHGEYLALINSDDKWLPDHLEKSVAFLDNESSYGAVFSWAQLIDEENNIIDKNCEVFMQPNRSQADWLRRLFEGGNCLCHPSVVIRKRMYDEVGFYKLAMRQLPDFDMWVRLLKKYPIYIIQEPLVQHRRYLRVEQNTSAPVTANSIRDINESMCVLQHFFEGISDELFIAAFSPLFVDPTAKGEQLYCEKYFLLLNQHYYMKNISRYVAFSYFIQIMEIPMVKEIFYDKYQYVLKDFYDLGAELDILNLTERTQFVCNNRQSRNNQIKNRLKQLFRRT